MSRAHGSGRARRSCGTPRPPRTTRRWPALAGPVDPDRLFTLSVRALVKSLLEPGT